ncbi:MAG: tetratricopeptide repeat protein [Planctomycetota bacterium]
MATTFGKYSIERKLGQGGMGAVYLALDPALNRRVALKVITSNDAELLERFQREASAVAKLKHPNIVQVYEAGVINKQHYFTMDFIEGAGLDKLIASKQKPNAQNIARIIYQVASALHYAHSQKIIHRDIKPANILVDNQGKAYIADFGLVKQLTGLDRSLTMTGTTVGTPDYMPPEQAMGRKDEIDPRSDIFSLGATLYHCITGRVPFIGKEIYEVLSKVINDEPPAPSTIMRMIPKDLETICLKCLNKDKAKRYQTAGALAQDLKRYLEGGSIIAKRTSSISKLWIKATKNKIAGLATAGAIVVVIAVVIGLMVSSAGKKKEIDSYRAEAEKAFESKSYDEAKTWCDKVLALSPGDEKMQSLLKKSEKIIKAQEDKKQQEDKQAKEAAAKAQKAVDLRAEAKAILDRAAGAPTPDQKIKLAQDALAIDPTFGDAYQAIGYAYKEKMESGLAGNQSSDKYRELIDKAYGCFTKAIETTPTLAYSYYERAQIKKQIYNKLEEAIPDFKKVLEYDPKSHIAYFARAIIEEDKKQYDDAIKSYTKAIELYPEYDMAYNNRGVIYKDKKEMDKAFADYDKAIELNPKFYEAYNNRGLMYQKRGDIDKALADYNRAMELKPDSSEVYYNRGYAYQIMEEFDKAIADYTKATGLDPRNAPAYSNRGTIYQKRGAIDKAFADYNKAIELNPDYAEPYQNRGDVYQARGEFDKAIAEYDKAARIGPKYAQLYTNRGAAYAAKGELDKAFADYNEALRLDPKHAMAYNNRGFMYSTKGELDKAIADYTQAIRLDPKLLLAYLNRGAAYINREELDKAIPDLTEAIRIDPGNITAYQNRGLVYYRKKEFSKTIADWEKLLELAPNHPQAEQIRKMIAECRSKIK